MPAIPAPQFDNLDKFADSQPQSNPAYGKQAANAFAVVRNDAASIPQRPGDDYKSDRGSGSNQPSRDLPVDYVSLQTTSIDAPPLGAFLLTNLHDDNWLDPTTPHISPESQGKPGKARSTTAK